MKHLIGDLVVYKYCPDVGEVIHRCEGDMIYAIKYPEGHTLIVKGENITPAPKHATYAPGDVVNYAFRIGEATVLAAYEPPPGDQLNHPPQYVSIKFQDGRVTTVYSTDLKKVAR